MVEKPVGRHRLAWLAVLLYWAAIAVATHTPSPAVQSVHQADKLFHFVAYAGLALLVGWAIQVSLRKPTMLARFGSLTAIAAYAALDEWSQLLVKGRQADVWDWLADVLGAMVGMAVFTVLALAGKIVFRDTTAEKLPGSDDG